MLTRANLQSFFTEIPHQPLPKTIQEAIDATRVLGLDYIWIDALCIIQQDKDDWLIEAGRMRSVYGGSYINLAASAAEDAHQGLYGDPGEYYGGFAARIGEENELRGFCDNLSYIDAVQSTPLSSRA